MTSAVTPSRWGGGAGGCGGMIRAGDHAHIGLERAKEAGGLGVLGAAQVAEDLGRELGDPGRRARPRPD